MRTNLSHLATALSGRSPRVVGRRTVVGSTSPFRGAAHNRTEDESGAVLILALVFLVSVSLIVTGLLTWVGTSLTRPGAFKTSGMWSTGPPLR